MRASKSGSTRGARFSLRSWVALFLQERRRYRAEGGGVPAAPVITGSAWEWGQTEAGWVDIYMEFTFDHGAFPVATLEVWAHDLNNADRVVAVLPSDQTSWWHNHVAEDATTFYYRMRYVNGPVVGPFSNEIGVLPYNAPAAPSNLQAEGDNGGSAVLTWDMTGVDFEDGVLVEGRRGSDEFAQIGSTGPDVGSWMGGVASGNWEFRVRAWNGVGFSDYSNTASATVM